MMRAVNQIQQTKLGRLKKDLKVNWKVYFLALPVIAFYILFKYKPMYGVIIAFKKFSPRKGIIGSDWVGFLHFKEFFKSYYFWRLLRNTLNISLSNLIFGFPVPIIFALLLNEVKNSGFKKSIQTISYMPHFISMVVICSLIRIFTAHTGPIVQFLALFGYDKRFDLLNNGKYFVPIHVLSGIWQNTGWNCIIYLSALAGINEELYDAAFIDGANRWRQTLHVTLPGILGTIVLLFILRLGSVMNVGHEKIILLYNSGIYEHADVISTFVYRRGLIEGDYSYTTAIGLFKSAINLFLVVTANRISNKVLDLGIW